MPNKKSKPNASKGKSPAHPSGPAKAAVSVAPTTPEETTPYIPLTLPKPSIDDDFWTKNARAKALILSTLVPGSEAWKIAEPIEIASDIWRALEDHFTPKRMKAWAKQRSSAEASNTMAAVADDGASSGASKSEAEPVNGKLSSSSNSVPSSVPGKLLDNADKYMDMSKDKISIPRLDGIISSGFSGEVSTNVEDARRALEAFDIADIAKSIAKEFDKQQRGATVHETVHETLPETTHQSEARMGLEVQQTQSQAQTEFLSQIRSQIQAHATAHGQVKPQPQAQSQAQAQQQVNVQAQAQIQVQGQSKVKVQVDAQAQVPAQSQAQPQSQAEVQPQVQSHAQGQSQAQPAPSQSAPGAGIPRLSTLTPSGRWKAHPVKHDSYLSEQQALIFARYDEDRKKQIQVAATKVLMQKLPTRDMRLLWAVLYGGEDAPWPGSCSAVIPGVTTLQWQNKSYEMDYKTLGWSWNSKADEKG
ncbi:uncharacterized protein Z519_11276 [Cladophialophora bantiana CBS 173.52]|uniref:Uncharacterized protein n=1 Tax=Cladophialophora bantiana (strain ATCC 10958 / CBS 173.52 / CDC B-1940 / NIH 8579) TaxID=1442370 RepID=A0A0D2HB77_CLAB1|nr:uncharacterized protein Z519_11276 [Cladophialophora bantiana CBS 173.52]KIW88165.1 hypothetical protein Z519_11276 [Cladophialophora bantiana CBS 173.52]